ncbi:hypothetical protein TVAG_002620 [Trichomonas vaginalis G3]|uniref:DUF3447 domain-containing protein n=1 Tax=Trichomonas vaginalis (strain ATCC PRA-98 / G3) TaxID=412133 RepID=A2G5S0_TRIV3|nr:ankyrin repeat domain-containing protein 39 homolog-related family [Trichomonas vaginalis G3]EAX87500.1 hypothetical protein TVAG_002620 [Trichomonas vaginalis G3]KAI5528906.1 ankyrin repeat domain-containing protein 39 homolog-related family [Trichomonas vaginalis G3]|eukprot:XP_001300430.1 hypothetical protein [Trichomonas vaginalis G3]
MERTLEFYIFSRSIFELNVKVSIFITTSRLVFWMTYKSECENEVEKLDDIINGLNNINKQNDSTTDNKSDLIEKLQKLIIVPEFEKHRNSVLEVIRRLNNIDDLDPLIPQFHWNDKDSTGKTLLMCIAKSWTFEKSIKIFEKIKQNPELDLDELLKEKDRYGRTAIYFAIEDYHAYKTFLHIKSKYEDWGEDIYDLRDNCGRTLFFYCLKFENYEGFLDLMENDKKNTMMHKDDFGNVAFCEAVKSGRNRTLGLFLWLYYGEKSTDEIAQYMYDLLKPNFKSIFSLKEVENFDLEEFKKRSNAIRNELNFAPGMFDINATYEKSKITLFFLACKVGYFDVVKVLVRFGCNPNLGDIDGNTSLHVAMKGDFIPIIKYLIEELKCDVKALNKKDETPVMFACFGNKERGIKYLIESGIDFGKDLKDKQGRKAEDICRFRGKLTSLEALNWQPTQISSNQEELSDQKNPKLPEPSDQEKEKIFNKIKYKITSEEINKLYSGTNLNFISPYCPATVLVLKDFKKFEGVSSIIDPNIKDIEGLTPLLTAVKKNKWEVFCSLFYYDHVDKYVKDLNGNPFNILMTIIRYHKYNFRFKTFLQYETPLNMLTRILPQLNYEQFMQTGSKGETVFHHLCASKNKIDVLNEILKCKKSLKLTPDDFNLQDKFGLTPLHYAVMNGNNETVQYLLNIFDGNPQKYLCDYYFKMTPVEFAVIFKNIPALKMLLFKKDFAKDQLLDRISKLEDLEDESAIIADVAKETTMEEKKFDDVLNLMMKKLMKNVTTEKIEPIKDSIEIEGCNMTKQKRVSLEQKLNVINKSPILKEKLDGISKDNFHVFLQSKRLHLIFHHNYEQYDSVSLFEGYRKIECLKMLLED